MKPTSRQNDGALPVGDDPPTGFNIRGIYGTERTGDTLRFYVTCAQTG